MEKIIEDILKKYYDEDEGCYSQYREEDEKYLDIQKELAEKLTALDVNYKLEITEAYDSPGYSCAVLSIAYLEPNNSWGVY